MSRHGAAYVFHCIPLNIQPNTQMQMRPLWHILGGKANLWAPLSGGERILMRGVGSGSELPFIRDLRLLVNLYHPGESSSNNFTNVPWRYISCVDTSFLSLHDSDYSYNTRNSIMSPDIRIDMWTVFHANPWERILP